MYYMFVVVYDYLGVVPLGEIQEFRACSCFTYSHSSLYIFPLVAEHQLGLQVPFSTCSTRGPVLPSKVNRD